MRHLIMGIAASACVALSVLPAGAQRHAPPPPPRTQQPAPPPAPFGPPPPPILYPFPPLMTPPAGGLPPLMPESPRFRTTIPPTFNYGSGYYTPFVFGDMPAAPYPGARQGKRAAAPATGLLRLSVTPPEAQVFIDSYYVGTAEQIMAQRVLSLEAGPHRIEIRAPQRETATVDVRILPYETVTYNATLEFRPPPAAPTATRAAAGPTAMYLIPNCYLGNVPPRASRLPAGCDIKRVEVLGR
jgi:hypothetical protein